MRLIVNGETQNAPGGTTVLELLEQLGLNPRATVVERNGDIVERDEFPSVELSEGDVIELVRFVGGG